MRSLQRHPLLAVLAALAALPACSVPAHAVGANVPLPQTPVQLPQSDVTLTAPGADVNVGPGGANVNIDPQKTVDGITGGGSQPGGGTPSTGPSLSPSQQAGSGSGSPGEGGSGAPVRSAPRAQRDSDSGRGSAPGGARDGTGGRADTGRAARETGSSTSGPGRSDERLVASRRLSGEDAAAPSVMQRLFERIPTELLAALLATALLAAAMSLVWLRERGRVRAAQRRAEIDPLTGIPNRLAFEQRLATEWKRARRYDRPLGMLLLDLDGLKRMNDRDGHEAGDRMIRAAAAQISADTRQSDLAARLAGDEFVVLCPETSGFGIEQLGAKLTERLQACGTAASVGWAVLGDGDVAPGDLLARADAAMYQEKARRRGASPKPTARPGFAIAG